MAKPSFVNIQITLTLQKAHLATQPPLSSIKGEEFRDLISKY